MACLGLQIPLEAASNQAELSQFQERQQKRQRLRDSDSGGVQQQQQQEGEEERVVPQVPFQACVQRFAGDSTVADYYSAALGKHTTVGWLGWWAGWVGVVGWWWVGLGWGGGLCRQCCPACWGSHGRALRLGSQSSLGPLMGYLVVGLYWGRWGGTWSVVTGAGRWGLVLKVDKGALMSARQPTVTAGAIVPFAL